MHLLKAKQWYLVTASRFLLVGGGEIDFHRRRGSGAGQRERMAGEVVTNQQPPRHHRTQAPINQGSYK